MQVDALGVTMQNGEPKDPITNPRKGDLGKVLQELSNLLRAWLIAGREGDHHRVVASFERQAVDQAAHETGVAVQQHHFIAHPVLRVPGSE